MRDIKFTSVKVTVYLQVGNFLQTNNLDFWGKVVVNE